MKCFVTGASGFIGSNLVRELLVRGHRVKALIRPGANERGLFGLKYERVLGDILDRRLLEKEMADCNWCFHLAERHRWWMRKYDSMYRINVDGTRTVLEAAGKVGCQRVIHGSTAGCIGLPKEANGKCLPATEVDVVAEEQLASHYIRSKYQAEAVAFELFRKAGLPVIVLNPTEVIGPGDWKPTATGKFIVDFLHRKVSVNLPAGLNWIHVHDVVAGHILAAEKGQLGERYILANREGNWTAQETLNVLAQMAKIPAPQITPPGWFTYRLAEANEMVSFVTGIPPFATTTGIRLAQKKKWFNPGKAIRDFNLPQTPPLQAFTEAVQWFSANGYAAR